MHMRSFGRVYLCTGCMPNNCFKSAVEPMVRIDEGTYFCIEISGDKREKAPNSKITYPVYQAPAWVAVPLKTGITC